MALIAYPITSQYVDAKSILATNEAEYSKLAFVNPDDARLGDMWTTIARQQKELLALQKQLPDDVDPASVVPQVMSTPMVGFIEPPASA